jgi:hypothetical protein
MRPFELPGGKILEKAFSVNLLAEKSVGMRPTVRSSGREDFGEGDQHFFERTKPGLVSYLLRVNQPRARESEKEKEEKKAVVRTSCST